MKATTRRDGEHGQLCPNCGDDTVCEGLPLCTDCVETLWPTAAAETAWRAAQAEQLPQAPVLPAAA